MSSRPLTTIALLCLLCGISTAQANTIYKYVDKDGRVTFTNIPIKGAKPFLVTPSSGGGNGSNGIANSNPNPSAAPAAPSTPRQQSAGNIPSVKPETQRNRDRGRNRILQDELANEQKALADARKALQTAGNADATQKRKLQDEITDRERNISALQSELNMENAPK